MQKEKHHRSVRLPVLISAVWLIWTGATHASSQYRDLIDMPALKMASARYALTLDVTHAGQRLVIVGERGHILFSDDQAMTWQQAEVNTRAHLNAVTFADAASGWAVGEDAVIVHTKDGGRTWSRQFDARNADPKGPLLDVWFKNIREGFAVGVYNKIYKTSDGGKTWADWAGHVDNPDAWHLFAIAAVSDRVIYLASEQGLIFRSENGGDSFTAVQTDHSGSFHGILARQGTNGLDTLVLSGVGGVVFMTNDSGGTWNQLDSNTAAGLSGSTWLADGTAIIVGYGGMLLHVDPVSGRVSAHPQQNGLPLSSVATLGADKMVIVGFGGPQTIDTPNPGQ